MVLGLVLSQVELPPMELERIQKFRRDQVSVVGGLRLARVLGPLLASPIKPVGD